MHNLGYFSKVLEQGLNLPEYGQDLIRLAIIFIVLPYETALHPEQIKYYRKKKLLIVEKRMSHELVEQLEPEEIPAVMAQTFLASLKDFPTRKMSDFDLAAFEQDAQHLFEKKGWLVHQEA